MGPVGYADSFGGFNQRLQDYYVERAKNDVGLIITGICSVDTTIEGFPAALPHHLPGGLHPQHPQHERPHPCLWL